MSTTNHEIIPRDIFYVILSKENVVCGSFYKSLVLTSKFIRDITKQNVPNGDVELCNPIKTAEMVLGMKTDKAHPWNDIENVWEYKWPWCNTTDQENVCLNKGNIPQNLRNYDILPKIKREIVSAYIYFLRNNNINISNSFVMTVSSIDTHTTSLITDESIRKYGTFLESGNLHLCVRDIIKYFNLLWNPIKLSMLRCIFLRDFFEFVGGVWELKKFLSVHPTLRDMKFAVSQNLLDDEVECVVDSVISNVDMWKNNIQYISNVCHNATLDLKHIAKMLEYVRIGEEKPSCILQQSKTRRRFDDILQFWDGKSNHEWLSIVRYSVYTWKDIPRILAIKNDETTKRTILSNGFGRVEMTKIVNL